MIKVEATGNVALSATALQEIFLDHPNLNRFFNAKFRLLKKSDSDNPNGVGAVRLVDVGVSKFKEEVIFVSDTEVHYKVIGDRTPVKDHLGQITWSPSDDGSCFLTYTISCTSATPVPDFILKWALQRELEQVVAKLQKFASNDTY